MKDKRCIGYCGAACIDGRCPIAIYYADPEIFDKKPSCKDCSITKDVKIVALTELICVRKEVESDG